jgi:hypothetical protein
VATKQFLFYLFFFNFLKQECIISSVLLFDKTRTMALKGQAAAERQRAQPVL